MEFTSDTLEQEGFEGFVPWADLALNEIPPEPGIYVVVRRSATPPVFLATNRAGRFKGRNPTEKPEVLRSAWVDGASVLYIGKAANLQNRLRQYREHGEGKPVGHWGGRYIWQLSDCRELGVAWKVTDGEPRQVERELLASFRETYDQLPFANLTS